jgi:hypothetical protein
VVPHRPQAWPIRRLMATTVTNWSGMNSAVIGLTIDARLQRWSGAPAGNVGFGARHDGGPDTVEGVSPVRDESVMEVHV